MVATKIAIQSDAPDTVATVAICTHNGAQKIGSVLKALSRQQLFKKKWEILVIDNASTDGTGEMARQLLSSIDGVETRVVFETQPGLSFARERAGIEAHGQIVCFLDDDNIPSPCFVANAIRAFEELPNAGIIGGKILARWESNPTPLAKAVAPYALAICDKGDKPLLLGKHDIIVGAGMCLRRSLLREIFSDHQFASKVPDRTEARLISGGDDAITIMAQKLGWDCWYLPYLEIEHIIPAHRMEKEYLLRLYEGIGRGHAVVSRLTHPNHFSVAILMMAARDIARWLRRSVLNPQSATLTMSKELWRDLNDLEKRLFISRAKQALHFW